ncbi:MAG: aldo/keto reductase, partial [Syntrophothermus sp.]
ALAFAIDSGRFGSIQCSVNLCDQSSINNQVKNAAGKGMGVIGKRPIANAPWRYESAPVGHHHAEYWHRFHQMNLNNFGLDWNELAMRFAAFSGGVSTVITGTSSREHLLRNIKAIEAGPLPDEIVVHLQAEFNKHDNHWTGLI